MCNTSNVQKTVEQNINTEKLFYSNIFKNLFYEFFKINNT